jgi:hypothetical protein
MKSLKEIFIGALVFIAIDRLARVISSSIVDKSTDNYTLKKTMLRIELLTLAVTVFVAVHYVKLA